MQSAPIDHQHVRRLFARPERLKAIDFLHREVSARMMERLQLVKLDPACIIDAGCGRGADLAGLHNLWNASQIIGVDGSEALLQVSEQERRAAGLFMQRLFSKLAGRRDPTDYAGLACGDFAQLPLPPDSADLLWSNMALHWHSEPDLVFGEWLRVLRSKGLLMFSCLGPDSLKQVRDAFEPEDQTPHTLPFVDMHDFGDMLVHAGFATPVMDMEVITLTYTDVDQLFNEVRALGGNPLRSRRSGMLGRSAWQRIRERLHEMRDRDGRIPLTFEVIYGHAFKPEPSRLGPGESIIKFDMLRK
jgi:malonyl-CoA O-methyltransferase